MEKAGEVLVLMIWYEDWQEDCFLMEKQIM